MAKKAIAATIVLKSGKYMIESDAIIDVTLTTGVEYKKVRLIGMNQMSDGIRVIASDGLSEIPIRLIESVKDSVNGSFSAITKC